MSETIKEPGYVELLELKIKEVGITSPDVVAELLPIKGVAGRPKLRLKDFKAAREEADSQPLVEVLYAVGRTATQASAEVLMFEPYNDQKLTHRYTHLYQDTTGKVLKRYVERVFTELAGEKRLQEEKVEFARALEGAESDFLKCALTEDLNTNFALLRFMEIGPTDIPYMSKQTASRYLVVT